MKIFIWIICIIGYILSIILLNALFIDFVLQTGFSIIALVIFIIPFSIFLWHKIVKPIEKKIILVIFVICLIVFCIFTCRQIEGYNYIKNHRGNFQ